MNVLEPMFWIFFTYHGVVAHKIIIVMGILS